MLFCSIEFIFIFLPIVLLIYYLAPERARNPVLFLSSLGFYIYGERQYAPILLLSVILNFFAAKAIEKAKNKKKRRALLVCTLLLDFGVLFFFKYLGFTVRNLNRLFAPYHGGEAVLPVIKLVLPLGISFYTFQLASYVLDVYGKKVRAERKFTDFGTYLCFRS